ncbi:ABC transporter ATP-binding protein [Exiguobacterium sp. ERU656]|uniref:ABC transporter ATP-binding protein n=1 Tax=Exiguobacterium sp. ERU656 TaxID=2751217 RepID=UPI001BE918F9|nr:ABC transporter ATP-binding protein [Exiguobacterium sp. ERU656]
MINLKWAMTFAKPILKTYIFALLLIIVEATTYIYSIKLQQKIIDNFHLITLEQNLNLFIYIFMIFICYVIFSVLYVINPFLQTTIYGHIKMNMTTQFLYNIYDSPLKLSNKENSGHYIHNTTNEIPAVAQIIGYDVLEALKQLSLVIITSIIMIQFSKWLFISVIVFSLFYFMAGKYFANKRTNVRKLIQKNKASLTIFFKEAISSSKETISFLSEPWIIQKYETKFTEYFNVVLKDGKLAGRQIIAQDFFSALSSITILSIGSYQIIYNDFSIGKLLVIYQLNLELINSFQNLCNLTINIVSSSPIIENVKVIFDQKTTHSNSKSLLLKKRIDSITFFDLSLVYNDSSNPVFKNINIDLPIGQKTVLTGESGIGKSSFVKMIAGVLSPSAGCIKINNIDINQINRKQLTEKIKIASRDSFIFNDSIKNNILMGRNFSKNELEFACKIACIHNFIVSLDDGYNTVISDDASNLSGGQKQRIIIARALVSNPEILILDEATSALDNNVESEIQRNLDVFRKNKTTLIISHNFTNIEKYDNLLIFKKDMITKEKNYSSDCINENRILTDTFK